MAVASELDCLLSAIDEPACLIRPEDQTVAAVNAAYTAEFGAVFFEGRRCWEALHRAARCPECGLACPLDKTGETHREASAVHAIFANDAEHRYTVITSAVTASDGKVLYWLERIRPHRADAAAGVMVGKSAAFRRIVSRLASVSQRNSALYFWGEEGSGRELAARTVHENSPRATGPFVKINLAGMTVRAAHDLFAGEVSGGIAGCATGLFAQAAGGTLFLERVDEADGAVLFWLCEVLHREEYEGVKGFTVTDFRWMMSAGISSRAFAAFGEAQKTLVAEAVPVFIEPLSARRDDVELLVRHFLSDFRRQGEGTADVSPEALSALTGARWKANIRELRETVFAAAHRAAAEDASCITPEMLSLTQEPADEADSLFQPDAGIRPVAEVNDLYIRWAVNRFSGSRAQLARRLGISERTLYRLAAAQRLARKKSAVGK